MLREYCNKKMLIMLLMSFSSGLPIALVLSTLQMWYTVSGMSLIAIGMLTLIGQPYTYKFLWAPLLDRYIPPFLGRRRGWILITQCGLLVGIFLMALFAPNQHPMLLASIAVVVAFLSASQDVVLDAYRTDVLTQKERGAGLAIWANGYRIAMIVSGAFALMIAQEIGWQLTYMLMSVFMLVGIITTFFCDEPSVQEHAPQNLKAAICDSFGDFLKRPYAVWLLVVIVLYKLGDAFSLSLSSPFFYRELGFSLLEIGWVFKVFGTIASLSGAIIAGAIMTRWSLYKSLMVFGFFQSIAILMFTLLAITGKDMTVFIVSIFVENFTSGLGTVALLALLTALCDRRFSATQYALLSAVMSLGRTFIGPIAGVSIAYVSWAWFFVIGCLLGLLSLVILWWLEQRIDFSSEKIG